MDKLPVICVALSSVAAPIEVPVIAATPFTPVIVIVSVVVTLTPSLSVIVIGTTNTFVSFLARAS